MVNKCLSMDTATSQLNGRGFRQTLRIANETEIVVVLRALGGGWLGIAAVQAGKTLFLVTHSVTRVYQFSNSICNEK
jgi:hypothetical protein